MKLLVLWLALAAILVSCGTSSGSPLLASPSPVASASAVPTAAPQMTDPPPTPAGPRPSVMGTVTAGPVCPVERNPPDPACAPRPVAGAVIVATTADGREAGRTTTAADGTYQLIIEATGSFVISGLPVPGLLGLPEPVTVTLAFASAIERVDLEYDTGIR